MPTPDEMTAGTERFLGELAIAMHENAPGFTKQILRAAREEIAAETTDNAVADYAARAYALFLLDCLASNLDGPTGDPAGTS